MKAASNIYRAEVARMIERRAADVERLGVLGAISLWVDKARREEGPSWQWQEPAVLEVLSEKDIARLDSMHPAKAQGTAA